MRRAVLFVLCCACAGLAATPKLIFTKSFPGSIPPYVFVSIDRDGALQYKEDPKDQPLVNTQLPKADTADLFDLAKQLQFFKQPIESGLKVANTGKKTFRYEAGDGVGTEVVFNYSLDPNAKALWDRFEQIADSERAYLDLDRTVHFDKLGVNDALAEIESLWLRRQLAAPLQFIPLLTRVANHESYMHLARERAARLKDEFTGVSQSAAASPKK
ncbi:MAG TPA: hypothetical protein VG168_18160 [Bryobacteraceae bacterium]|nr:hypothetical protein [Bryobacteraceae bacterium]